MDAQTMETSNGRINSWTNINRNLKGAGSSIVHKHKMGNNQHISVLVLEMLLEIILQP